MYVKVKVASEFDISEYISSHPTVSHLLLIIHLARLTVTK